jgi:hypothetical protein
LKKFYWMKTKRKNFFEKLFLIMKKGKFGVLQQAQFKKCVLIHNFFTRCNQRKS